MALPFGRLKPVLAALSDFYLGDPEPQRKLRLGAPDAARLADLDELPLAWEGGDNLRDFARRLRSFRLVRRPRRKACAPNCGPTSSKA